MMVYFLNPFPIRGEQAPYLWIFYKILAMTNEKSVLIASDDYFNIPDYWRNLERYEVTPAASTQLGYDVETAFLKIKNHFTFSVSKDIWDSLLKKNHHNPSAVFEMFLTEHIDELYDMFDCFFSEIQKACVGGDHIEAIVTWCNCPSLTNIATKYNIPLIHQELGPLRGSFYNELCYFDFQGVNGNTQSRKLFEEGYDLPLFSFSELQNVFFKNLKLPEKTHEYIGVVFQVEDDSNVIAYSNGWNNISLLNYVRGKYQDEAILIRSHPGSLFNFVEQRAKGNLYLDKSANSVEFISKCKKIITTNSSVGFEALLHGVDVEFLGEASFKFINEINEQQEITKRLNFYLLCYLIPKSCQLDVDYIRFRLENPSKKQIFLYHLRKLLGIEMDSQNDLILSVNKLVELQKSNETFARDLAEKNDQLLAQQNQIEGLQSEVLSQKLQINDYESQIEIQKLQLDVQKNQIFTQATDIEAQRNEWKRLCGQVNSLAQELESVYGSNSWKITKPLRFLVFCLLHPYQAIVKAIAFIEKKKINKVIRKKSDQQCMELPVAIEKTKLSLIDFFSEGRVIILTTQHCDFVATELASLFGLFGYTIPNIMTSVDAYHDDYLYIVFTPQMFELLPDNYIAFQMEQSVSSRWFTESYIKLLENARFVFDYSVNNIEFIQKKGIAFEKLFYLPIGVESYDTNSNLEKKIDVLFYGDDKCERRAYILDRLSKKFKIEIVNNLFGSELCQKICESRIVLNIHYYENALLETTRLYECLKLGALVVSEKSSDFQSHEVLHDIIDFVNIGDVDQLEAQIAFWLSDEEKRWAKIKSNMERLNSSFKHFSFFFGRFLLSQDLIDFDVFYETVGKKRLLSGNRLCLGLPESLARKRSFERDNLFGFEYFTGLRHRIGWIGCGLSYKYMMMLAKKDSIENVLICEDDVLIPEGFEQKFSKIDFFLNNKIKQWDIFSGLIAVVDDSYFINHIHYEGDLLFLDINKSISMVMNYYNKTIYDYYITWNYKDSDAETNTIDKFIETKKNIKTYTMLPFLVGHKEELESTLWGISNTIYSELIQESQRKLTELALNKINATSAQDDLEKFDK